MKDLKKLGNIKKPLKREKSLLRKRLFLILERRK